MGPMTTPSSFFGGMDTRRYRIRLEDTGQELPCRPGQTVLAALAAAGRRLITVGCEAGGCGVCKVEILEGTWSVVRPMSCAHVSEEEQARGRVLACRVKATSDLVVRVIGKEPVRPLAPGE